MVQKKWMKNWRIVSILSACLLLTLATTSCKKSTTKLSDGTLSPDDLLASGAIDTFSLQTYSQVEDSFQTDNQTSVVLGEVHDPKFGISNASFYTQFNFVGDFSDAPGAIPLVDSVVLSLRYAGYFGKLTPQTFEVHELDDTLSINADYYTSSAKMVKATNLVDPSNASQTPRPTTNVVIDDNDTLAPQLRLRLDNSWGEAILSEGINTTTFDTEAAFKTYFKGLKVSVTPSNPAPNTGGLFYFNLNNNDSKITFYYKIQGETDQKKVSFIIDNKCADFTHVNVDNSGYGLANVLNDSLFGMEEFYTQNFRASAVVKFPSIDNFTDKTVIHNALLELPIAFQTGDSFTPSSVVIAFKTIDGKDYSVGNAVYNNQRKSYVIDLRDYIQDIVTGNAENIGIKVISLNFSARPERIVFNGPLTSNKNKPKLTIKYTEF